MIKNLTKKVSACSLALLLSIGGIASVATATGVGTEVRAVQAAEIQLKGPYSITKATNLYQSPSTSGKVLRSLPVGSKVYIPQIDGTIDGMWQMVMYDFIIGWVPATSMY